MKKQRFFPLLTAFGVKFIVDKLTPGRSLMGTAVSSIMISKTKVGRLLGSFRKHFWRSLPSCHRRFFVRNHPPHVTEASTLQEITTHYPDLPSFLGRRFGLLPCSAEMRLPISQFVEKYGLPPSRILFMELQLSHRIQRIHSLSARQAKDLLESEPQTRVLDVREPWELATGALPRARPLDARLLGEIMATWPKQTPVLLYCHFGVRSLDAAAYLADQGFTCLHTLAGGIDAWSQQIDERIPRYSGSWC